MSLKQALRLRLSRPLGSIPIFALFLFMGALSWAKWQDPFVRRWFKLKSADNVSVKCVAVLPKPVRRLPVVIYAHGSESTLTDDGFVLRQMAGLGLAVVSFDYNRTNGILFPAELEAVQHWLGRQKWAETNAVAWVGYDLGASRMLESALWHQETQPELLVQVSDAGIDVSSAAHPASFHFHQPVLFIRGDQDEISPMAGAPRLALWLQTNGVPVQLITVHGWRPGLETDRGAVFRCIGEYCLEHLADKNAWQNHHSTAQWEKNAPPLWLFCLPATAWAIGWLTWRWRSRAAPRKGRKFERHEIALRGLAGFFGTAALAVAGIRLITPRLAVNEKTLSISRSFLVTTEERPDFEILAAQPIWAGQKLKTLLTIVQLADYNRELINWQVDERHYRDDVLSPIITGRPGEKFDWRRSLWEEFYPRIRLESSVAEAARTVIRHLRGRITIVNAPNMPHDVPAIWMRQITDEAGFEIIYAAALRSVGIPAKLNSDGDAEFYDGDKWQAGPEPLKLN